MGVVRFTSHLQSKWVPSTTQGLDAGVAELATDIHRRAIINAPVDSRALVNSAQIVRYGIGHYAVRFGSRSVPYARRRHFENKKNPQTLGYLEKAGDSVTRGNVSKYFRGK